MYRVQQITACCSLQTNKNIKVYTLNGRRVSEDVTARDCPGRRTAWMPIQLEQKALYRYGVYVKIFYSNAGELVSILWHVLQNQNIVQQLYINMFML